MTGTGYRQYLRSVVAASAAPHGYTLTIFTTGSVTIHAEGAPAVGGALLFLTGAALAFGLLGVTAFGGLTQLLLPEEATEVRLWGALHLPSVGLSVVAAALLGRVAHGNLLWALVGFTATGTYLVVLAGQLWLAARGTRRPATPARPSVSRHEPLV